MIKRIFDRYAKTVSDCGFDVQPPSADAVLAMLRLAIEEAYNAHTNDNRPIRPLEQATMQLEMLNEWLADNEPALYCDPNTNTAEAILLAIAKTGEELKSALADVAALCEELKKADEFRASIKKNTGA